MKKLDIFLKFAHLTNYQFSYFLLVFYVYVISSCTQNVETKEVRNLSEMTVCGTVQFSDGCGGQVDSLISYGLALVHHMTYNEAESVFDKVITESPDCFWGHWGKALTFIHPVWPDAPDEEKLKQGWELSQKALSLATKGKEKAFGNALAAYYKDGLGRTEQERLKSFEQAWEQNFKNDPKDLESKSFYALLLIATADAGDKTYKNQIKAGALAEEVLNDIPDHPGGFHYAIHAYDNPQLGEKGIHVANSYGNIAPEVPHALHMPSHIYTRRGMWNESIDWNKKSAQAALLHPVQGAVSIHYFHALDYIVYARLQKLEDVSAKKVVQDYKMQPEPYQKSFISAYALAAMESRYLLERQAWGEAAKLELPETENFNWNEFPESSALIYFTKGLGAARAGSLKVAEASIKKLEELKQITSNPYWAGQIEIQKNTVAAWFHYAQGNKEEAHNLMKLAAEQESATEKHPVTPGELLPAVELYGDLLMALNKPEEALEQYEAALTRSPGRFNSLYGAAHAAELIGNNTKAKDYYKLLVDQTKDAEINIPQRSMAVAFLNQKE